MLVAAPNIGTPLRPPADRFEKLISWWTNLLELFPENPLGPALEYIGEALTSSPGTLWMHCPGIESMDMSGNQISVLNIAPGHPSTAYSTVCSNYQPQGALLARMLDMGIDGIFGMANDLVVPTTGAWKTDDRSSSVPGARIGCFGINLTSTAAKDGVIHTTYFSQPETVDFLIDTLLGQPLNLPAVDQDINPPFFLRRSLTATMTAGAPSAPAVAPSPGVSAGDSQGFLPTAVNEADNILVLTSPDDHLPADAAKLADGQTAILLATYRNARVVETIYLRHAQSSIPEDGDAYHWNKIIGTNERIKNYVDGKSNATLPNEDELLDLGVNLFNAMLPGGVRRLCRTSHESIAPGLPIDAG